MYILEEYQKDALKFLLDRNGNAGIALSVGYGKTLIALDYIKNHAPKKPVLVAIPASILSQGTWSDEIEKFDLQIPFTYMKGTPKQRIKALKTVKADEKRIFFISHSNLKWLVNIHLKEKLIWYFDTVILDEMHKFKNSATNNFKAAKKIRKAAHHMIGLTGTPKANDLVDLWALSYLIDGGKQLAPTKTKFLDTFFDSTVRPGQSWFTYTPKRIVQNGKLYDMEKIINTKFAKNFISSDALKNKLPPVTYNEVTITLSETEKEIYETLKKEYVLETKNDRTISAPNAAAILMKLRQLANGFAYTDKDLFGYQETLFFHRKKIEALQQIREQTDDNIIVAVAFKADVLNIQHEFKAPLFNSSPEMKEKWNKGEIPMMLINSLSSAKEGGNLQFGGATIVWYSPTWSLTDYTQLNGRVFRTGQTRPVVIHHIVAKNTVDELMLKKVDNKQKKANELLKCCLA